MRRISSLPTSEFCPKVDKIGQDIETTQSARSTIFHAYCDTGKWSPDLRTLPQADIEEISKWRVPMPFFYKAGEATHALPYKDAYRETRVALDTNFDPIIIDRALPQADIAEAHPNVMIVGHLDMAWVIGDLVIVCDIKSSIWAVRDRCDSLQLHGYGLALAKLLNKPRYLTSIWDASEARYYVANHAIELEGFECEDIKDRIAMASTERDGDFRVGVHCSGCWKRSRCPAHTRDVPEGELQAILSGNAMEADVRLAIIKRKQIGDLANRLDDSIKAWVSQHGPVRSEDGKKQYQCEQRAGKMGLDKDAVCRALGVQTLDDYMKPGKPFSAFDWRNRG
jgi:hypothetical protein